VRAADHHRAMQGGCRIGGIIDIILRCRGHRPSV
jgi:hypothetical protein